MKAMEEIEKMGTEAVKVLRQKKLKNGHPFMINSKELPTNQCYLEYPDGSIALVTVLTAARDFTVLKTLSKSESDKLREKHNLSYH